MKNYDLLFEIIDSGVNEIKINVGTLLAIYYGNGRNIRIKIHSMLDGKLVRDIIVPIQGGDNIKTIELFSSNLLIKPKKRNLMIFNVSLRVKGSQFED